MKKDLKTWENFRKFPETYKRIRIGWISGARHRPEIFKQRLRYFFKMTSQNKKFGMVQ
ncbi:MAG: YdeI/OmpD-associated family protein [Ignavibacteria bacterium]